jgi:hypothetical protein
MQEMLALPIEILDFAHVRCAAVTSLTGFLHIARDSEKQKCINYAAHFGFIIAGGSINSNFA